MSDIDKSNPGPARSDEPVDATLGEKTGDNTVADDADLPVPEAGETVSEEPIIDIQAEADIALCAIQTDPQAFSSRLETVERHLRERNISQEEITKIFDSIYQGLGLDKDLMKQAYQKASTEGIWIAVPTNKDNLWLRVGLDSPASSKPSFSFLSSTKKHIELMISFWNHNVRGGAKLAEVFPPSEEQDKEIEGTTEERVARLQRLFVEELKEFGSQHINFFVDQYPEIKDELQKTLLESLVASDQLAAEKQKIDSEFERRQVRSRGNNSVCSTAIKTSISGFNLFVIATDSKDFPEKYIYRVTNGSKLV